MTWLHQFTAIELFVEIAILNLIGMTIKVNQALGSIPPGSSKMGDATLRLLVSYKWYPVGWGYL